MPSKYSIVSFSLIPMNRRYVITLFEVLGGSRPLSDAQELIPASKVLQSYSERHNTKRVRRMLSLG